MLVVPDKLSRAILTCDWSIPIVVHILQNSMPFGTTTQSLGITSFILPGMLVRACLVGLNKYVYIYIILYIHTYIISVQLRYIKYIPNFDIDF